MLFVPLLSVDCTCIACSFIEKVKLYTLHIHYVSICVAVDVALPVQVIRCYNGHTRMLEEMRRVQVELDIHLQKGLKLL
jgi:hypothetical protein